MNDQDAPTAILVEQPPRLPAAGQRRILVLKLDHLGDLIAGKPALAALRKAFPADHITLICGSLRADLQADPASAATAGMGPRSNALGRWTDRV